MTSSGAPDDPTTPVPGPEEEPTPARIVAFSDGVFAVIITLLVLDLRVPRDVTARGGSLGAALLHQWPVYVAFVVSFLQVGVVWANHHAMFHYIRRSDHRLLLYNLLLLLCATALPFTTALVAEYARAGEAELRLSALLYSGVLGICGVFFDAVWTHALNAKLVSPHANPHRLHAFLLALVNARISLGMYAVLLLYYALPGPIVLRRMTAHRARAVARLTAAIPDQ